MPSFWAGQADPPLFPRLTSFYDEACATLARLFVYAGALVLLGILGLYGLRQLQPAAAPEPAGRSGWTSASRSYPAFAVSVELLEKSRTYTILRHLKGGRKDVFRWPGQTDRPTTEFEVYRPGAEAGSVDAAADLAGRMPSGGTGELETAGMIDSRFGPVRLLHRAGSGDAVSGCLGFLGRIDGPALQISGWSCAGNNLTTRRLIIGCMLDRLTLLAPADDPELADFFSQTEPTRGGCTGAARPADWVSRAENPRLRGGL